MLARSRRARRAVRWSLRFSKARSANIEATPPDRAFFAGELCRFLLLASLFPFAVCARAQVPDSKAPPSVSRSGPTVVYDGLLNDAGLRQLAKILEADGIRELQITSGGGSVDAGIKVGNLVFDKGLDVIVAKSCLSSCANYVFTAGRRKQILPGAIVAWHGSVLQKDFRER